MAETFGLQLVNEGIIDREALYDALRLQRERGGLLGTCLLALGHLKRGALLQSLARHLDSPPAPPSLLLNPDQSVASLFEAAVMRRLGAAPYTRDERGVYLAFADPRTLASVKELALPRGESILLRVATEPDVAVALDRLYGPASEDPGEGDTRERFMDHDEVEFAKATGFDQEKTAMIRLDSIIEKEKMRAARERVRKEVAASKPDPTAPVAAGWAMESPPGDAPSPVEPAPPKESFGNEAEIEFARATGMDREATAIFRLDDIAELRAARDAELARQGGELPAPATAPRLAEAAEALFEAKNEGVIARQVVKFFAGYFPRVMLLARHGETMRGVLSHGTGLSGPEVAALRVPAVGFTRLFEDSVGYYGPAPGGSELEPLYEALGEPPVQAFIVPIETVGAPSWLIYADHGTGLEHFDEVHELEIMAKEVSIALNMLREQQDP